MTRASRVIGCPLAWAGYCAWFSFDPPHGATATPLWFISLGALVAILVAYCIGRPWALLLAGVPGLLTWIGAFLPPGATGDDDWPEVWVFLTVVFALYSLAPLGLGLLMRWLWTRLS
jgi:peptidoglycan/LPS O-acetylase OafA/YrhL